MKKLGLFLFYFLYIFNCSFNPLPYFLRTRVIFAILGLVLIVFLGNFIKVNKYIIRLSVAFYLLLLPIFISSLLNSTFDVWMSQYLVLLTLHFTGAYLVVWLSKRCYPMFSVEKLFKYIFAAIIANSVLAVAMYLMPSLNAFIFSIQNFDDQADMVIEEVLNLRLMGMGIGMFFMGGIIWGLALLFVAYLIRVHSEQGRGILGLTFLYFFIMLVGTFIARTTLVGALLGFVYICWPRDWRLTLSKPGLRRMFFFYGTLLLIIAMAVAFVFYRYPQVFDSEIVGWAFEMFINASDNSEVSTGSTQHLGTMFIWPDNVKTWLIGDGLFNVQDGYYMGTDVGYLRLIFYFGIFGAIIFFGGQFYLFRVISLLYKTPLLRLSMLFMAVYVLVLNIKGFADVNAFMFLLFWVAVLPDKTHANRNEMYTR